MVVRSGREPKNGKGPGEEEGKEGRGGEEMGKGEGRKRRREGEGGAVTMKGDYTILTPP